MEESPLKSRNVVQTICVQIWAAPSPRNLYGPLSQTKRPSRVGFGQVATFNAKPFTSSWPCALPELRHHTVNSVNDRVRVIP